MASPLTRAIGAVIDLGADASSGGGLRTARVTSAPVEASARAVSMPMPGEPHVTIARLSRRSMPATTSVAVDLAVKGLVMRPRAMVVHATCARETPRSAAARLEGSGRPRAGVGRIIRRLAACRCLLDRPHPCECLLFGDRPLRASSSKESDPPTGQRRQPVLEPGKEAEVDDHAGSKMTPPPDESDFLALQRSGSMVTMSNPEPARAATSASNAASTGLPLGCAGHRSTGGCSTR